ncbi:ACP S-malonyltransferase [Streptomyces agglomeratus]|uniref:ACP S-malonyltransferase n=1 Tax=Streptomyces agglomeratus TaxID=285458 RepID=UPI0008549826|nr:ACP S-malonyltransferase [Streptomyces agglomeratus]OEJ36235.1 ACP S-malonyltransferase [Streptomyces agglomeratus]
METENRTGSALVFPGMGPAPFTEVARFMLVNPFARALLAEADDVLGYSLFDRFREVEGDYSEYAQVAFMVNCLALAQWAEAELGAEPAFVTGPSFGGKATAVHSGALSFADGVRLTARFANCLDTFFAEEYGEEVATLSFARTPRSKLDEVLAELTEQGEWHDITCVVDEDFFMLTVRKSKLDWLQQRLRTLGGLPLYVMEPPMHSEAFGGLRRKAEAEVMSGLEFRDPRIPVVADQDGTLLTTGDQVRNMLLDGCVRAVNWPDALASLRRNGVGKIYVAGQDALFGRVAVAAKNFEVVPVNPRLATRPRRRAAAA